jgi:hypothetical protein
VGYNVAEAVAREKALVPPNSQAGILEKPNYRSDTRMINVLVTEEDVGHRKPTVRLATGA